MSPGRILFYIALILTSAVSSLHSEELWNHIMETSPGNGYQKKIINLGLQINYLHYLPAKNEKKARVLVIISRRDSGDVFVKSVSEKLQPEISVLNYQFNVNKNNDMVLTSNSYQKMRLLGYFTEKQLTNRWAPMYPEVIEIRKEVEKEQYQQRYLLITGDQSHLWKHSSLLKSFHRCISVSPDESLLDMDQTLSTGCQFLWVGAAFEKDKLEKLKNRFGGTILTYSRGSSGQNLLMRNFQIMDDVLKWLNSAG